MNKYNKLCRYTPPKWCEHLKGAPTHKVNLALIPTPIHQWKLPNVPEGTELYIKRDDMTGSVLSGNKVRKLEFLLGDALQKGFDSIITCGSLQSNHCRATAAAASQLGMKSHFILRTDENVSSVGHRGNLFLSRLCNSDIYLVPKRAPYETELKLRQEALAKAILENTGKRAYCICVGGSDRVGLHGYLNAWEELLQQGICDMIDDVVVACGSGGTVAGLAIGNYLTGSKLKIHAIAVCDDKEYFYGHINDMLKTTGIENVRSEDIVDIIEGYKGAGYGTSTLEDHELYNKIIANSGIYCDPVYSGKGIKGLINELNMNGSRFKGKRVLFIHTGGIFGMFDGKMSGLFNDINLKNRIHDWKNITENPDSFIQSNHTK